MLVIILLWLKDSRFWLIYAYMGLQTLYFWYMTSVVPHEERIHNGLEYFNELGLITLQYTMLFFVEGSGVSPEV